MFPPRKSKLPEIYAKLSEHIATMEATPPETWSEARRMNAISIELGQQICDEMLAIIESLDTDYIPMEL